MLAATFLAQDHYLCESRPLWQFVPFAEADYPWRHSHPKLAQWLDGLSDHQVSIWQDAPEQSHAACAVYLPQLKRPLAMAKRHQQTAAPFWLRNGIKGRKWQQISAFSSLVSPLPKSILEWCAGKGHLGRLLAWQANHEVTSLEWQATLCQQGQQSADKLGLSQQFFCTDVLKQATRHYLQQEQQLVALHACGQLHINMLQDAVANRVKSIRLCPCCYQLIPQAEYQPMSRQAAQSALQLSRQDLRLAVQETVTAHQRERDKRQTEKRYRQMFDIWQRSQTGIDEYLAVPSAPDSLFRQPPLFFCQWAAEQKGLQFDAEHQLDALQQAAEQRIRRLERMELIQHLFRRTLEHWLVLDRALYLEEQGYAVTLVEFCDREITPRNLAILADLQY